MTAITPKTIQQAVDELASLPPGSSIELPRPTGHYRVWKDVADCRIYSQCRGSDGRLRPRQQETPQYGNVGK